MKFAFVNLISIFAKWEEKEIQFMMKLTNYI
jgi:hypothetical protein